MNVEIGERSWSHFSGVITFAAYTYEEDSETVACTYTEDGEQIIDLQELEYTLLVDDPPLVISDDSVISADNQERIQPFDNTFELCELQDWRIPDRTNLPAYQSEITLPYRCLTDSERAVWIAEY